MRGLHLVVSTLLKPYLPSDPLPVNFCHPPSPLFQTPLLLRSLSTSPTSFSAPTFHPPNPSTPKRTEMSTIFFFLLMGLLTAFPSDEAAPVYHEKPEHFNSAACCARGPECWKKHAMLSKSCKKGLWMSQQPSSCQKYACEYCAHNRLNPECKTHPILKNCFKQSPPYPKPDPFWAMNPTPKEQGTLQEQKPVPQPLPNPTKLGPSNTGKNGCSFNAKHGVVNIAARNFPVHGQWKRTSDGAVIWKEGGGGGIDAKGTGGFCVSFKPDRDGLFYFTVLSSAPHYTEHNDAWFKSTASVVIYRPSSGSIKKIGGWFKGFQNEGKGRKADYILTVDNNGHQIFLEGLKQGVAYNVCAAGRSTRYKLFNFVFMACDSLQSCARTGPAVKTVMSHLPGPANCV